MKSAARFGIAAQKGWMDARPTLTCCHAGRTARGTGVAVTVPKGDQGARANPSGSLVKRGHEIAHWPRKTTSVTRVPPFRRIKWHSASAGKALLSCDGGLPMTTRQRRHSGRNSTLSGSAGTRGFGSGNWKSADQAIFRKKCSWAKCIDTLTTSLSVAGLLSTPVHSRFTRIHLHRVAIGRISNPMPAIRLSAGFVGKWVLK
ncbi:hypothetical protein F5144DRAFT_333885 [Chaetomium tenue]|uniref:Uncharacterized protein n=1 Tax=Chaetomium tenue TaxID=1854479 RepID=A0ACB7NW66_9PEZI|nr:hypothetical protein F5144DRAFT_333885 [Chaetomium globosum]